MLTEREVISTLDMLRKRTFGCSYRDPGLELIRLRKR